MIEAGIDVLSVFNISNSTYINPIFFIGLLLFLPFLLLLSKFEIMLIFFNLSARFFIHFNKHNFIKSTQYRYNRYKSRILLIVRLPLGFY